MAYQSMYAPSDKGTAPAKGGGYQSLYGFAVPKAPSAADLSSSRQQKAQQDQQAKQKKQQQDQQAQQQAKNNSLLGKVKSVSKNLVNSAVTTGEKSLNTVAAGVEGAAGATKAIAQKATGNSKGAAQTVATTERVINDKLTKGAGGKGAYLTPAQAQKGGKALIKPGAQAVTDILPYVAPVGKVAEGASLATKAARGALDNAVLSGGTTVANEAIQGNLKKDKGGEIAKSLLTGAVVGGALPLLHGAVKEGAAAVSTKDAKAALQTAKQANLLGKARGPVKSPGDSAPEATQAKPVPAMATAAGPAPAIEKPVINSIPASELVKAQAKQDAVTAAQPTVPTVVPPHEVAAAPVPSPVVSSAKPEPVSLPQGSTVDRGTSKVASSVQEKAVARGLKNDFGEAGGYDRITIADQAAKAVKLANDRPALEAVINGSKPLPDGLRATALIKAVEEHPELSKDIPLLNKLSQAEHLTGESSRSAQELRLAAERTQHSPVEAIRQVRAARTAAVEKRTGMTVNKAVSTEVRAAQAAKPKVKIEDWHALVDSLRC